MFEQIVTVSIIPRCFIYFNLPTIINKTVIIPRYLSEGTIGLDPEAYKFVYSSYDCPNNDMAVIKNTVSTR